MRATQIEINRHSSSGKFTRRAGLLLLIALIHFLLFFHLVFKQAKTRLLAEESTIQFRLIERQFNRDRLEPRPAATAASPKKLRTTPIHQAKPTQRPITTVTQETSQATSLVADIPADARQESTADNTSAYPTYDLKQLRAQVLENERTRKRTPAEILREQNIVVSNATTKFEEGAKRAEKKDCRTAYSGVGLLAIIPLAINTVVDTGCKW